MHIHIHPILVHFPIALFISALGLEILSLLLKKKSLHQTAVHIYILAACVTPLAVKTGLWEAEALHLKHNILDWHRLFALWGMWVSLISLPLLWFIRERGAKYFRIIFPVVLLAVVALVTLAAYNGGRMVYEYGVGVEG